jgi:hypothetical protein
MKASFLLSLVLVSVAVSEVNAIELSPVRSSHAATLLNNGTVLLTGGVNTENTLNSALLYDPVAGTLLPTGNMVNARADHASTLLADGRVLVTGGDLINGKKIKSGEIYDPATGTFTQIAKAMSIARTSHTGTLLPDGRV